MIGAVPVASLERRRRMLRMRKAAAIFMSDRRANEIARELATYEQPTRAELFELAAEAIRQRQKRHGFRLRFCDDLRVAAARIANAAFA